MLIRTCSQCKYHEVKHEEDIQMSYCSAENCWSQYSKCVANRALNRFLRQESSRDSRAFSALDSLYSVE